jgi:hypothetical protein
MKEVRLWSAVYRVDRTIFDLGDTNMLVEAWHHLRKGDFLEGKRNRRLDHLIHALCEIAIPHFIARHHRQAMGFEGPDLAFKHRMGVISRAVSIPHSAIQLDPETSKYVVRSQSDPDIFYEVDLDAYDCTCLSFPLIRFCKHICAFQNHFPEAETSVPVAALLVPQHLEPDDADIDPDLDWTSESELALEHTQAQKDQQSIDDLARRLQSLMLSCLNPLPVMTAKLRQAISGATEALDILDSDLTPLVAILPRQKARIPPNQHSWPETRAVMNIPVKSKKRKDYGPYGGNERSGKRAKPDAREPSIPEDPPSSSISTPGVPEQENDTQPSYYRLHPNAPAPGMPPPALHSLSTTKSHGAPVAFDVDTFDLSDNKTLARLNNRELRSVCAKHDIETARSNDDMVKNIQDYYRKSQRRANSLPRAPVYPSYLNMYYPAMYYPQNRA